MYILVSLDHLDSMSSRLLFRWQTWRSPFRWVSLVSDILISFLPLRIPRHLLFCPDLRSVIRTLLKSFVLPLTTSLRLVRMSIAINSVATATRDILRGNVMACRSMLKRRFDTVSTLSLRVSLTIPQTSSCWTMWSIPLILCMRIILWSSQWSQVHYFLVCCEGE